MFPCPTNTTMTPPQIPIARFKIFADGLDHPEGLALDADGRLWAGGELGQIYRLDRRGRPTEIARLGGFCLGLTFSSVQELYVCNFKRHALIRLNRQGRVLDSWERVGSKKLCTPNFSVFDSQRNLYFSDSGHWGRTDGCVYRLRPNKKVEYFAGPFAFANGLSLSADERFLYVVESLKDDVVEVEIRADGTSGKKRIYAAGLAHVPDGAAFDALGNLYVTAYASNKIYKVSPRGKVSLLAFDPQGTMLSGPTNIAFGGPHFDQMFVANLGRWHIGRAPAGVKGQRLANLH
ncbi:MAG: SMP-30/gluconolactonase/LRE family protein [Candidatus Acidiferrales bacterium]